MVKNNSHCMQLLERESAAVLALHYINKDSYSVTTTIHRNMNDTIVPLSAEINSVTGDSTEIK